MFTVIATVVLALGQSVCASKSLPDGPLNMGYVSICDANKTIQAVENGLNVVFWFSIDLANHDGVPAVVPSAV